MPRVVPSQVVALIDEMFPSVRHQLQDESKPFILDGGHLIPVAALLELLDRVPHELLPSDAHQYSAFVASVAALEAAVRSWEAQNLTYRVFSIPGFGGGRLNPVTLIRRALSTCPDEFPSVSTAELNFIQDQELREGLRIDVSATNQALSNGEWKAATVLAGSVVEALLLWALQQRSGTDITKTTAKLIQAQRLRRDPGAKLDEWYLPEYIEVAAELKVIRDETAAQARLAKDFRNLIHPGRAVRLGQKCDRGTALSAVAAVQHVLTDLTP